MTKPMTVKCEFVYIYQQFLTLPNTVSAQIERHSWLERQETHFGCTMVNFGEKSSENTEIFDDFSPKKTIVSPKYVSLFKMGFYWRGYGKWLHNRVLSTLEWKALHLIKRLTLNTDQTFVFTFLPTVSQIFNWTIKKFKFWIFIINFYYQNQTEYFSQKQL